MASATVPVGASEGIEGMHTYTYDALGRRVSKSMNQNGTISTAVFICTAEELPDGDVGQVLAEHVSGDPSTCRQKYVYAASVDEACLFVDCRNASEVPLWYHANSQGSIIALTDDTAFVVEAYNYDAYGHTLVTASDGELFASQVSAVGNSYAFTGRRIDVETSTYFYRTRSYDPQRGSFLSRDSIGYTSTRNLYQYVGSMPTQYVDPDGRKGLPVSPGPSTPIHVPGNGAPPTGPYGGYPANFPRGGGFPLPIPHPSPKPPWAPDPGLLLPGTPEWEIWIRKLKLKGCHNDCRNWIPAMPACTGGGWEELIKAGEEFLEEAQRQGTLPANAEFTPVNCRPVQEIPAPNKICGGFPAGTMHCKALVTTPHGVWVTQQDVVSIFICSCCDMQTGDVGTNVKPFGTTGGQGSPHFPGGNRPPKVDIGR